MLDHETYISQLVSQAREAAASLATASTAAKDAALLKAAKKILAGAAALKKANAADVRAAEAASSVPLRGSERGMPKAMADRLRLNDRRIAEMAEGLRAVAALRDPVGEIIGGWTRPNGLRIEKVRVPLGVILMIYEARPNVTADAASLCLKSGNAVILRGGKEALRSNLAIHAILAGAVSEAGLDPHAVQMVNTPDRAALDLLLRAEGKIDVVIPRGGEGLIRAVAEKSRIPVLKHYKGVCHTFVDASADLAMAEKVCLNAKVQRPSVCNAMETMLVHAAIAKEFLPRIAAKLKKAGCEMRGDARSRAIVKAMKPAAEEDWATEYNDLILSIRVVDSLDEAIRHIARYGTQHSDAILTRDLSSAREFAARVDSAAVFINTSTRFHDGAQFGMGAEIGISTDKLHARGPMALPELTSYKYVVYGDGQIRE
jgi:glutamate-5-semialdehyde dehydrogenase